MKYELKTKKWFISKDGARIVQGLITKREMLEIDDHNLGRATIKRYFLRTDWSDPVWVDEEILFDTIPDMVAALSVPCNFE